MDKKRSNKCFFWLSGNAQAQVEWRSEQPGPVKGVLEQGGVEPDDH